MPRIGEKFSTEIWRDIPKYIGMYQVSNFGRVKSLSRFVGAPNGGVRRIRERILKQRVDVCGYRSVGLNDGEEMLKWRVHQLVILSFVGPGGKGAHCRHLNGNKEDNRLENLQWGTVTENAQDRIKHGTSFIARGSKSGKAKIKEEDVLAILSEMRKPKDIRPRVKDLAKRYKLGTSTIYALKNGKSWKHMTSQASA